MLYFEIKALESTFSCSIISVLQESYNKACLAEGKRFETFAKRIRKNFCTNIFVSVKVKNKMERVKKIGEMMIKFEIKMFR